MHTALKLCNIAYWMALTMWVSALSAAAIAAGNVFGTMPRLGVTLERYKAVPPDEHWRLAAGKIMEGVFFTVDLFQFVAAPLTLVTLLLQLTLFRMPARTPSNWIRTACLVLAMLLFGYHVTAIGPRMNRELHEYWRSAEAGDLLAAESHRAAFNADHPIAMRLLQANLILVMIGIGASAVALGPVRPREHFHIPSLLRMR